MQGSEMAVSDRIKVSDDISSSEILFLNIFIKFRISQNFGSLNCICCQDYVIKIDLGSFIGRINLEFQIGRI